jgi:hypothetical protein
VLKENRDLEPEMALSLQPRWLPELLEIEQQRDLNSLPHPESKLP